MDNSIISKNIKTIRRDKMMTQKEFGKLIGVKSTSSAFSRIKQLEECGYIRRVPASPRAIEIL